MSEVATSPADFSNISLIGRRVLREMTRPYSLNLGQEMGESMYAPNATDDFVADTKNAQDWNILGSLASIRYGACDLTPAAAMPNPRMELAYKGGRIRAVATMKFPRVMVFEGLVTAEECERLIEAAKPRLMRSEVAGPDPDVTKGIVDDARTSFGTSLPKEEFKLIETIDRRLSKLL